MTKTDLVAAAATKAGVTKAAAEHVLNAVLDLIVGSVKKGDKVTITGFGTFSRSKRKARTGVNPRTMEKIQIPAQNGVKFSAGKTFKDAVK